MLRAVLGRRDGLSACFTDTATPCPDYYIDDTKLPIYTVICALYGETAVVDDLVAAIRALDFRKNST